MRLNGEVGFFFFRTALEITSGKLVRNISKFGRSVILNDICIFLVYCLSASVLRSFIKLMNILISRFLC